MEYFRAYLVCKEDLICDGDDLPSCVSGKKYDVVDVTKHEYMIINDYNQHHYFKRDKSDLDAYYGIWFDLELE